MKETLKSVSDVESGVKNLSEEQVKQQFHPFVESVARRQKQNGNPLPMEELIPFGEEGLLEAWRQYDPASGCKFVPYAVWFVRKAMERRLQ
jgi:DNA-directed RNA polymerase sigma subunit (sigma70/sigma32)